MKKNYQVESLFIDKEFLFSKKNFLVIVFLFNSNIDCPYKSSRFYIVNQRRFPTPQR